MDCRNRTWYLLFLSNICVFQPHEEITERAGALVYWLWEETHVPKVVGSSPGAGYWMDMTFFHIDLL